MFNKVTKTFQYGQHQVTLETGEIARQASGAVMVSIESPGSSGGPIMPAQPARNT